MKIFKQMWRYIKRIKEPNATSSINLRITKHHRSKKIIGSFVTSVLMSFALAASVHAFPDVDGANDPNGDGQNDLTRFTYDDSGADAISVLFSFDEPSTIQGGNASNACIMFDTDGDGDINNSFCVEVSYDSSLGEFYVTDSGDGGDSVKDFPAWIECADSKDDRCGQPDRLADPYNGNLQGSNCSIAIANSDPFTDGNDNGEDLEVTCSISKDLVDSGEFVNICSYPSAGNDGNNNPFDCLKTPGKSYVIIEKIAESSAATDSFKFSVRDSGGSYHDESIEGSGTSDPVEVDPGDTLISEIILPAGWSLESVSCDDGTAGPTAGTNEVKIFLAPGQTTTCTFTNVAASTMAPVTVNKVCLNADGSPGTCGDTDFKILLTCFDAATGEGTSSPFGVTIGTHSYTLDDVNVGSSCSVFEPEMPDGWEQFGTVPRLIVVEDVSGEESNTMTVTNRVKSTPSLAIDKVYKGFADDGAGDVDGSGDVSVGDKLSYTITATNTGTANLTGVEVSDDLTGDSTTCAGPLSQNQTCVLHTTYTVASLNTPIANTGTAYSNQTNPVTDIENVEVPQPGLKIDKVYNGFANDGAGDLDGSGDVSLGDKLSYTITATSTGTANLTGVTVSDNLTEESITCAGPLSHNQTCVLNTTYTVTSLNTPIANTGTADSHQTNPVTDTVNVEVPQPSLAIVKTVVSVTNPDGTLSDNLEVDQAGDVIAYEITATNDGTANLTNVLVNDELTGDSKTCLSVLASDNNGGVAGTCVLETSYTATQADLDNDGNLVPDLSINNIATADSSQTGEVDDSAQVPVVQDPAHELTKMFHSDQTQIGDSGLFTLTYTNKGNVTNTGVSVTDLVNPILQVTSVTSLPAGAGECADIDSNAQTVECNFDSVSPGDSVMVEVEYSVVIEADSTPNSGGVNYVLYFANGSVLSGTTADGGLHTLVDSSGNEITTSIDNDGKQGVMFITPEIGGGIFKIHMSCSDPFVDGWPESGQPAGVSDDWKIVAYDINRYNKNRFIKSCGQTFDLVIDNTATADAIGLDEVEGTDSVAIIGEMEQSPTKPPKTGHCDKGNSKHKDCKGRSGKPKSVSHHQFDDKSKHRKGKLKSHKGKSKPSYGRSKHRGHKSKRS